MIQIQIFDVGHGQCAVATSPNSRRLMIDCGAKWTDERFWTPALHYYGQYLSLLAIMNLDEDHLSNFESLKECVRIGQLLSNPTLNSNDIRRLKTGGIGPGVRSYLGWLADPDNQIISLSPDFGSMRVWGYYNPYMPGVMDATNDLSLLLFIQYGAFKIAFSGDLENSGWRQMLCNPRICRDLAGTSVFVASHHGRKSGQCADIFNWFRPQIIVFSDDDKKYESQETDGWYAERCTGAILIENPTQRRYFMTTRNDGSMQIDVTPDGSWILRPIKVPDWPLRSDQISSHLPGIGLGSGFGAGFSSGSNSIGLGLTNPFLLTTRQ
jgi:hypothetical protein